MATFRQNTFKPIVGDEQSNLRAKDRLIGFEIEGGVDNNDFFNEVRNGHNKIFPAAGLDGGGIELVTHPIARSLLEEDHEYIQEAFKLVKKHLQELRSAGTHINVSKLPTDGKYTYSNLLWLQIIYSEQMFKVFRRYSDWARSPLSVMTQRESVKGTYSTSLLRKKLDMFIFGDEQTTKRFSDFSSKHILVTDKGNRYEFRGGAATTNKLEAQAWAQFCCNMVDIAAKNRTLANVHFKDFIKGKYIEEYINTFEGDRKLTREDLNRTVNRVKEVKRPSTQYRMY